MKRKRQPIGVFLLLLAAFTNGGATVNGEGESSQHAEIQKLAEVVTQSQEDLETRRNALSSLVALKTRGPGFEVNQQLLTILRDKSVHPEIRAEAGEWMLDLHPKIKPITGNVLEPIFDAEAVVRQKFALSLIRNLTKFPPEERELFQRAIQHQDPYVKLCGAWFLKKHDIVKQLAEHQDIDLALAAISAFSRFKQTTPEDIVPLQLKLSLRIEQNQPALPEDIDGEKLLDQRLKLEEQIEQTQDERKLKELQRRLAELEQLEEQFRFVAKRNLTQFGLAMGLYQRGQTDPEGMTRGLTPLLTDPAIKSPALRVRAIRALGGVGVTQKGREAITKANVPALLQKLTKEDVNEDVRHAAQQTINDLKKPVVLLNDQNLFTPTPADDEPLSGWKWEALPKSITPSTNWTESILPYIESGPKFGESNTVTFPNWTDDQRWFPQPPLKSEGGVHVIFGDGSVRFLRENIDSSTWWQLGSPESELSRQALKIIQFSHQLIGLKPDRLEDF